MFSRAAKSIVKTIGQQKFHAGEENIKLAMVGGAGEIGRSLSQMLKQTSKLDVLALYDVAALNKRHAAHIKPKTFSNGQPNANSRMLTMLEKSRTSKGDYLPMHEKETGELVESLRRLPIAEECATSPAPRPAVGSQLQATPGTQTRYQLPGNAVERTSTSPLEINGSIARASDRRNRGPLSITSDPKGSTTTTIDRDGDVSRILGLKNRTIERQNNKYRERTMLLEEEDRTRNDDYFPQGEEYEDEIGIDYGQLKKEFPHRRPTREEDMDLQSTRRPSVPLANVSFENVPLDVGKRSNTEQTSVP